MNVSVILAISNRRRVEVEALRAQNERLERQMRAHRETAVAAIAGSDKQIHDLQAALTAALEQNERFDKRYRDAEAENERLLDEWAQTEAFAERLKTALTEMLQSFTEPEDDNDILRRARAALDRPKDG